MNVCPRVVQDGHFQHIYLQKCGWGDIDEMRASLLPPNAQSIVAPLPIPAASWAKQAWGQFPCEGQEGRVGVASQGSSLRGVRGILNGPSSSSLFPRRLVCGLNAIEVEVSPIWKLLFKEVSSTFTKRPS